MIRSSRAKEERVIEALRQGMQGDDVIMFVRQNGFALTQVGLSRHLRLMGGRERIMSAIHEGKSNLDILEVIFPDENLREDAREDAAQGDLFAPHTFPPSESPFLPHHYDPFETTKMVLHLPNDLYQAVRLAAHAEHKTRNELIAEILTSALSQMPRILPDDEGD